MIETGPGPRHLRIAGDGRPGSTQIELDGRDITHALTGLNLVLGVDRMPTAVLSLAVFDTSTEIAADVLVPQETRALLEQLGWTAPNSEQQEGGA